jgi:hypothetical protein
MCSPEALYAQLLFLSQDSKQNEAVDSLVGRPSDEYVPPKRPVRSAAPGLLGVGLLASLGIGRKYRKGMAPSQL